MKLYNPKIHNRQLGCLHAKGHTDKIIGEFMGFAECTIQQRRSAMGLKPNRGDYKCNQNQFMDKIPKQLKPWPPGVWFN